MSDRTIALQAVKTQLSYPLKAGNCYNVDAGAILGLTGLSLQGAHSNLVHAEIAGLIWAAALSDPSTI